MDIQHSIFNSLVNGASLAVSSGYNQRWATAGFTKAEYDTLTQSYIWGADQARVVPSLISEAVQISLTLANLPAMQMPAEFIAAVIVKYVHPCNYLIAAVKAPKGFNASKLLEDRATIESVSPELMISMVLQAAVDINAMDKKLTLEDQVLQENIKNRESETN